MRFEVYSVNALDSYRHLKMIFMGSILTIYYIVYGNLYYEIRTLNIDLNDVKSDVFC